MKNLPDGEYPFGADRYPLTRLTMAEAPADLEALLQAQAVANGIEIIRGEPVELVCTTPTMETHRFLVFWPPGDRMHLLVPKELVVGKA